MNDLIPSWIGDAHAALDDLAANTSIRTLLATRYPFSGLVLAWLDARTPAMNALVTEFGTARLVNPFLNNRQRFGVTRVNLRELLADGDVALALARRYDRPQIIVAWLGMAESALDALDAYGI